MIKRHMVYVHSDINGHIFYCGMGKDKRPWSSTGRNKHWWSKALCNNIVHFEVELIHKNVTRTEARRLEKEYIEEYGLSNLTNIQR